MKGTYVFPQCNSFFCSTRPSDIRKSNSDSNKSCFILTSESAFDFRIFLFKNTCGGVSLIALQPFAPEFY